jgi:hypothetical protein
MSHDETFKNDAFAENWVNWVYLSLEKRKTRKGELYE